MTRLSPRSKLSENCTLEVRPPSPCGSEMPSILSELLSYSRRCGLNPRSSNVYAVATTCEAILGRRAVPNAAAISLQNPLMSNVPNVMSRSPQALTSAGIAALMFRRVTNGMRNHSLELSGRPSRARAAIPRHRVLLK